MRDSRIKFSVIVCTYNSEERIAATLESLLNLKFPVGSYEIIVVEDSSKDSTAEIVRNFHRVWMVQHPYNKGLSTGRNTGLSVAQGKWIAFIDDDCLADPEWLMNLEKSLSKDNTLGVGSLITPTRRDTLAQRYLADSGYGKPPRKALGQAKSPLGRFMAYLKDKFVEVTQKPTLEEVEVQEVYGASGAFETAKLRQAGGYDLTIRSSEDREICARLHANFPGETFRFTPAAVIRHDFMTSFSAYLRKIFYRQTDTVVFYRRRGVALPWYPFPIVIVLAALLALPFLRAWALVILAVLPLALYSWWVLAALAHRRPEMLAYSYMQALEEGAQVAGLVRALVKQPVAKCRWVSRAGVLVGVMSLIGLGIVAHFSGNALFHLPLALLVILLPGYLVARATGILDTVQEWPVKAALWSVLGLVWLYGIGLFAVYALPLIGVTRPLDVTPLGISMLAGLAALLPFALRRTIPTTKRPPATWNWDTLLTAMLLPLMVIATFIGAGLLNNGYSGALLTCTLLVAAGVLLLTIIRGKHLPVWMPALVLFTVSLVGVWSYSLRSSVLFGWDIQQEFQVYELTQAAGTWTIAQLHTPYNAMLSLTSLPTSIANLSGLSGLNIFKVMFPILFSFVPVLLYGLYKQFARRIVAFMAAAVFVAQFAYMQQFATTVRQQLAFLFFAGLLYALLHKNFSNTARYSLVAICGAGMIFSHYSTTYVALVLLVIAYLLTKATRTWWWHARKRLVDGPIAIKGWIVAALIASAALWYGPATQMSATYIAAKGGPANVSSYVAEFVGEDLQQRPVSHDAATYLDYIGDYYQQHYSYLAYYPNASNDGLRPLQPAEVPAKWPMVTMLAKFGESVLRIGWWVLGSIGVGVVAWQARRRHQLPAFELAAVGIAGVAAFVIAHVLPGFDAFYNITRLNQQVLMIVALPAVGVLAWLLRRWQRRAWHSIAGAAVCVSFVFAVGLGAHFGGGNAPANLNNFGDDYQRFYLQPTDVAAVEWLGSTVPRGSTVYADRYGSLHLTAHSNFSGQILGDITPESVSQGSFVYGDHTNVIDGLATSGGVGARAVTYQFPAEFLDAHKNRIYSNGAAEIYR